MRNYPPASDGKEVMIMPLFLAAATPLAQFAEGAFLAVSVYLTLRESRKQ